MCFTGLPRYALYGAIGYGIGHLMAQRIKRGVAEREIIIFDYIKNHPEDFPEYRKWLCKSPFGSLNIQMIPSLSTLYGTSCNQNFIALFLKFAK